MRIGLVCPYDLSKPGGVQAQVEGLARALATGGDDVTLIGPGLPDHHQGVDLGPSFSIPGNGSVVPIAIDPRVARHVKEAAKNLDILHVHEPLMPFASLTALRAGTPVVATFHAAPGAMGAGLYRILKSRLRQVLGPNVKRVTAVSATAAAPLPESLDITLVPNGLDVAVFAGDSKRVAGRVAFLGRDEPRKGLDILLRAWPTVTDQRDAAELVVMGAKRDDQSITWKGRVDDETKASILGSSEIYVAPNTGGESFGIVLLEAMAAGTPVVASDLDAFRDVAGDVARYFKVGDSEDLAALLVSLLGSETERREMSEAGLAHVSQFDWENVAIRYRTLYEESLS